MNLVTQFGGHPPAVIHLGVLRHALHGLAGPHVLKRQVDIRNRG